MNEINFPKGLQVDTIPINFSNGYIGVDTEIDGQVFNLFMDSGIPVSLLKTDIPSTIMANEVVNIRDINGNIYPFKQMDVESVKIGKIRINKSDNFHFGNLAINGFMGTNTLKLFVWKVSFIDKHIYISRDAKYFEVSKDKGIPFELINGYPFINATINEVPVRFLVDTGNQHAGVIINREYTDSLLVPVESIVRWRSKQNHQEFFSQHHITPEIDDYHSYSLGNIEIGDQLFTDELVNFRDIEYNLLGLGFLEQFDYFILDYPNQMLYFGQRQSKPLKYLLEVAENLNSVGVKISYDSVPIITAISSNLTEKRIDINDTVVSIFGQEIINQEMGFFNNDYIDANYGSGTTAYSIRTPSKHRTLIDNFNLNIVNKQASISIKKGDTILNFSLKRHYAALKMPDFVQSYFPDHRFVYVSNSGDEIKDKNQGTKYLYYVRPLPF